MAAVVIAMAIAWGGAAEGKGLGLRGKGLRFGLGTSNLNYPGLEQAPLFDFKMIRPALGVFLRVKGYETRTYSVDFQIETLFVMKGEDAGDGMGEHSRVELYYLELPMLARVTFAQHLYLVIGPYLGRILEAELHNDNISMNLHDARGLDLGVVLGVGVVVGEDGGFTVDARFEKGALDVFDGSDGNTSLVGTVGYEWR